jgi:DNA polymerase-3 subunit delta
MNLADLIAELKKEGLAPIYIIHGPESFTRAEALAAIKESAAREKPPRDFTELDGPELDTLKLIDDLRTPSLFAPSRLVIVDNAGALFGPALKHLDAYAQKPSSRNSLVLTDSEMKPKGTRKRPIKKTEDAPQGGKVLMKKAVVVDCPVLGRRELPTWCLARAQSYGKKMEFTAARDLIDVVGSSLGQLDGKIQALATFCREKPRIGPDDVAQLTSGDHARTIWDLVQSVVERKPREALVALNRLLEHGEAAPLGILPMLSREIRTVRTIQRMTRQRCTQAQIIEATKAKPWVLERAYGMARRLSERQVHDLLALFVEVDMELKSSDQSEQWIMERFVMRLCGVGK